MIELSDVRKVFPARRRGGRGGRRRRGHACGGRRRDRRRRRPQRRRQEHAHPLREPARAPHLGPGHRRRAGAHRAAPTDGVRAGPQPIGMVFQHFNLLSSRTVAGNVELPLEILGVSGGRAPPQGRGAARPGRPRRQGRGLPRAALRRPEAARRHRPRAGRRPQGAALRRGDPRPGPETTRSILELLRDLNRQLGLTVLLITHEMDVVKTDLRLGRADGATAGSSSPARSPNCSPPPAPSWPAALPGRRRGRRRRPHGRRRHLPAARPRPQPVDLAAVAHVQHRHLDPRRRDGHRRRQAGRPDAHRTARPLRGATSCRSASCASRASRSTWSPRAPASALAEGRCQVTWSEMQPLLEQACWRHPLHGGVVRCSSRSSAACRSASCSSSPTGRPAAERRRSTRSSG